jgi:hypothetical protein
MVLRSVCLSVCLSVADQTADKKDADDGGGGDRKSHRDGDGTMHWSNQSPDEKWSVRKRKKKQNIVDKVE